MSNFKKTFAAVATMIAVGFLGGGGAATTFAPPAFAGAYGVPGGGTLHPTGPIRDRNGNAVKLPDDVNAYYRCVDQMRWRKDLCPRPAGWP